MEPLRVLIADDEALVRHALRVFVAAAEDMVVVGEAVDGAEAIERCEAVRPDVVLMDLQMPIKNGTDAIAEITSADPNVRVLAVTTFSSESHVVAALQAGACGYLVKDTHPDAILQAIRDTSEGQSVLSPGVARRLVSLVRESEGGSDDRARPETLTPRELSIVRLLAEGLSNAEIAHRLHLSEATVKANLGRVMAKWLVRDRVQVLIHAAQSGIVAL